MTKSAAAWPSSTIAAAMSAPTSASVRLGRSHSAIRAWTRSMAAPAARSSASSSGVLAHAQLAQDRPARRWSVAPASRSWSRCSAGVMSETAIGTGREAGERQRVGVVAVDPRRTSTPSASSGRCR